MNGFDPPSLSHRYADRDRRSRSRGPSRQPLALRQRQTGTRKGYGLTKTLTRGLSARAIIFALALCASCGPALSQTGPEPPPRAIFYSNIKPLDETIALKQSDPRPTSAGNALHVFDWLLYGNITLGGVYDSNVFAVPTQQRVYGMRFQPYVIAERNTGIQRTLIYGTGDIRYYPSLGLTDVVNATAGVAHVWEIERDFVFRTQAEATRGTESSTLNTALSAPGTYTGPINYMSLFGSTSIEKSFGNFFTAVGGSVTGTTYDDAKDNFGVVVNEQDRNGTMSTVNGRIGYHISSVIYAFVEPSLNWGRFNGSALDSDGYRIVGGLGSARISLFDGEVYGGVLTERFTDPTIPTLSRGIYGGRVSWFPTRFITVTASVDQSLGTSDFSPNLFSPDSVTMVSTAKLMPSWSVNREWKLDGRLVFTQSDFMNSTRQDKSIETGLVVTYHLNSRFDLMLDVSHTQYASNIDGANYTRDLISLGGKTKF